MAYRLFICAIVTLIAAVTALSASAEQEKTLSGTATWYSNRFVFWHEPTANGERVYDDTLTCAARADVPFGTIARVTNKANGKSVLVRVNDRIPDTTEGVLVDLTKRAFGEIADLEEGRIDVLVEFPEVIKKKGSFYEEPEYPDDADRIFDEALSFAGQENGG